MMSNQWKIEPYSDIDKRIRVKGPLDLEIDFDDVWGPGVEVLAKQMIDILNDNWYAPLRSRCENEDCDEFWNIFDLQILYCPTCEETLEIVEVDT